MDDAIVAAARGLIRAASQAHRVVNCRLAPSSGWKDWKEDLQSSRTAALQVRSVRVHGLQVSRFATRMSR